MVIRCRTDTWTRREGILLTDPFRLLVNPTTFQSSLSRILLFLSRGSHPDVASFLDNPSRDESIQ